MDTCRLRWHSAGCSTARTSGRAALPAAHGAWSASRTKRPRPPLRHLPYPFCPRPKPIRSRSSLPRPSATRLCRAMPGWSKRLTTASSPALKPPMAVRRCSLGSRASAPRTPAMAATSSSSGPSPIPAWLVQPRRRPANIWATCASITQRPTPTSNFTMSAGWRCWRDRKAPYTVPVPWAASSGSCPTRPIWANMAARCRQVCQPRSMATPGATCRRH